MYSRLEDITEKMRKYCLYRDRCHQDVRLKLIKEEVYGDDLEQVMVTLIQERFLDEERFARSFAKGKFKQNKWGRNKIKAELKQRHLSDYCIRKAMEEIEDEAYNEMIVKLWKSKWTTVKGKNEFEKKQKTIKYLLNKGYEYELLKDM